MRWVFLVFLATSGCSLALTGQRMLTGQVQRADFVEKEIALPDGRYSYWDNERQDKPGLLLLHGFGGDGLGTWSPIMRSLSEEYHMLVPDLLWFGKSHGDGAPRLEAQVEMVTRMMDTAGLSKATVTGLSYGGFVALATATVAPERLERLVIVDSPGPFFGEAEEAEMLARFGASRVEDIFLPKGPEDVQRLLNLAWYKAPQFPGFLLKDLYIHDFSVWQTEQAGLLSDLRGRRGTTTLPDLKGMPVLVIWGRYDAVFPLTVGEKLSEALGGKLTVIEDAAHGPNIEKPKEVTAALRSFLEAPKSP